MNRGKTVIILASLLTAAVGLFLPVAALAAVIDIPTPPYTYADGQFEKITDVGGRTFEFKGYGCRIDSTNGVSEKPQTGTINGTRTLVCKDDGKTFPAYAYYSTKRDTKGAFRVVRVGGPDETTDQKGGDSGSYFAYDSESDKDTPITAVRIGYPNPGVTGPTALSAPPADDDGSDCDAGDFSWMICPTFRAIRDGYESLGNYAESQLSTSPLENGTGDFANARKLYDAISRLADAFFVIIFLLIIFANTTSIGISNYNIKRMLPRLIAAAIFVQFGWLFMQILVDLTNIVGAGIGNLIQTALCGGGCPSSVFVVTNNVMTGVLSAAMVAATLFLAVPILMAMLAAVIGILAVVITLLLRKIILVALIAVSPIALVAWIMPNTESIFKKWWSALTKLLLMYPIITALLAISAAGASFITPTPGAGPLASAFDGIASLVLPIWAFYFIPKTFKWAGAGIAAVSGYVLSQGQKASSRATGKGSEVLEDQRKKYGAKAFDAGTRKDSTALRAFGRATAGGAAALGTTRSGTKLLGDVTARRNERLKGAQVATEAKLYGINDNKKRNEILTEQVTKGKTEELRASAFDTLVDSKQWRALTDLREGVEDPITKVRRPETAVSPSLWDNLSAKHGGTIFSSSPHLLDAKTKAVAYNGATAEKVSNWNANSIDDFLTNHKGPTATNRESVLRQLRTSPALKARLNKEQLDRIINEVGERDPEPTPGSGPGSGPGPSTPGTTFDPVNNPDDRGSADAGFGL